MLTNDQKAEFLKQYIYCKDRIMILQERKRAYQEDIYGIKVPSLSGMPHGSDPHGVDDKVVKCISLTEEIDEEIKILIKKMNFIKSIISSVQNMKYRSMLEMRFIDGIQNKQVMKILDKSYQSAQTCRRKAIGSLPITEKTIKEYNQIQ